MHREPHRGVPAEAPAQRPSVPSGERVYAIGDIHGRLDLLTRLHQSIAADARKAGPARNAVIYLGDYIDRGPDSRGVVETLTRQPLTGFESRHLRGNHEDWLLRFLEGSEDGMDWTMNGGDATLESYGVAVDFRRAGGGLEVARQQLRERMPPRHASFFRGLEASHVVGDYIFVHAGIRPGVALEEQDADDLMWIRGEFLNSRADHGKVVVHGHSPDRDVQMEENRIGIDTAAYATGVLTCLVLETNGRRFLRT